MIERAGERSLTGPFLLYGPGSNKNGTHQWVPFLFGCQWHYRSERQKTERTYGGIPPDDIREFTRSSFLL